MSSKGFRYGVVLWLVIGLTWIALPERPQAQEPTVQGRSLRDWQRDVENLPAAGRVEAVRALTRFGDPAAPVLIKAMLEDPDANVREAAVIALAQLGPATKHALPALIRALKDPEESVRWHASAAIHRIGVVAVPALVEALKQHEATAREAAAVVLARIGPPAKDAVPALVQALKDPNERVRIRVSEAIPRIGPAGVPVLIRALEDPDAEVREGVALGLARIGPAARDSLPALVQALMDPNERVRVGVCRAIPRIGPASKDAASALIQALKDPDDRVREEAALGLGLMRLADQDAIPELRRLAASDPSPFVSSAAERALKAIRSRQ